MLKTHPGKITPGMALRVFADVLMVQFSLLAGLSIALVAHLLIYDLLKTKTPSELILTASSDPTCSVPVCLCWISEPGTLLRTIRRNIDYQSAQSGNR